MSHHYEIPKTTTRYGVQFQDARIPLMEADLISKTNQIDSLENKNLLLRSQLAGEQVLLRQAEARIAELENAWARDESIQPDGSLRPSVAATVARAEAAEARVAELERENAIYKAGAEKLDEMVEQFHNGEAAYELGNAIDEKQVGDIFRIGYAWSAYYDQSMEISRLKGKAAMLKSALEMVEWVDHDDLSYCPWCLHTPDHSPDCPRQAVLNET